MVIVEPIKNSKISDFSDFLQEQPKRVRKLVSGVCSQRNSSGTKKFLIKLSRSAFTNEVHNCSGSLPWGP